MWRLALAAVLLVPSVARAAPRVELELASGVGAPIAGSDYASSHDPGLKMGLRGVVELGTRPRWHLGMELAVDWIDRESHAWAVVNEVEGVRDSTYRLRGLLGLRLERDVGEDVELFVRVLAGVDRVWTEKTQVQPPGEPTELAEFAQRDQVRAAELGLGATYRLGHVRLGFQLGLPMAFYDPAAGSRGRVISGGVEHSVSNQLAARILVHDTVVELDALLTVGAAF